MVRLGSVYKLVEVEADDGEAAKWFQKGAEHNDASAMYDLGTLYENGQGVPKSVDKAKEWYVRSAGLGNTETKKRLEQDGAQVIRCERTSEKWFVNWAE